MKKKLLYLSLVIISISSCKKDPAIGDTNPADNCIAGTGGNVTVVAFPEHHLVPVLNKEFYPDSAFVKFNTLDLPSQNPLPSDFDTFFVGHPGEDHIHISGLKCGKYFIYVTAFDTTDKKNTRVVGGLPVNIIQTSGEKVLKFAVSEVDGH